MRRYESSWLVGIGVFVLYAVAAQLGLELATLNQTASPVWPASGIAIASLFVFGRRLWPSIALGALLVNALSGIPIAAALVIAFGNSMEALVGAVLLRKISSSKLDMYPHNQGLGLIAASGVGSAVSASVGTLALISFGLLRSTGPVELLLTWWVGDFLGGLIVAPVVLTTLDREFLNCKGVMNTMQGALVSLALITVAAYFLFVGERDPRWLFSIFPPLLLIVYWMGGRVLVWAVAMLSLFAVICTVIGTGPFRWGTQNTNLLNLQLFLAGVAIFSLITIGIAAQSVLRKASLVLVMGWIISSFLVNSFVEREIAKDRERLNGIIADTIRQINTRMSHYEDSLRSAASLIRASERVEPHEWRAFVESLDLRNRYPGVRGMGTINVVRAGTISTFEREMRKSMPGFRVQEVPAQNDRPNSLDHYVITYIEPLEHNRQAVGLDVGSEHNRREGADLARDTGIPTVTRRITLVQDEQNRAGFLLYLPTYKPSMPQDTVEQRQEAFLNWIYAPFVTEELFKGILENNADEIEFSVFDSDSLSGEPIFATKGTSASSEFEQTSSLVLGQRVFSIGWQRSQGFNSSHDSTVAWIGFVGAIVSLLMAGFVATLDGTRARAQAIANQQTELLRESQEKMVAASRLSSLGEMAAGIAHEINNPLTIISLNLEMVRQKISEGKSGEVLKIVDQADQIVARISQIILNLRKFGRDGGQDPFASVSIQDVVQDAVSICGERFRQKQILLKLPDQYPGSLVRARAVQLSQVLVNLLSNAFDEVLGQDNGHVQVGVHETESDVVVQVIDNGPGVPEAIREKIMQPFFTTKEVGKGTGLGLSISQRIMVEHQGRLEYEPRPIGSCFSMIIPKA